MKGNLTVQRYQNLCVNLKSPNDDKSHTISNLIKPITISNTNRISEIELPQPNYENMKLIGETKNQIIQQKQVNN